MPHGKKGNFVMLTLPATTTALILIDLQKGIVGSPTEPYPGPAVLAKGQELARRFRAAGAPVVLVNVAFAADFADRLKTPVDRPPQLPSGGLPEGWADLADGLAEPSDIRITKRHWGAFHGTELDLQLRRRGITTLVIGGIATNIGVESTARAAHEHSYAVVLVEDATTGRSAAMHAFAFEHIFPLLGRVVKTDAIALA
jgi:nicotinamidase-related amidase